MERYECLPIDNLHMLRAALATGDISLYEIENALQQRMDEELRKPDNEVDGDLVERLEEMLQIPHKSRLNGNGGGLRPRSFDDLMEAIKQEDG